MPAEQWRLPGSHILSARLFLQYGFNRIHQRGLRFIFSFQCRHDLLIDCSLCEDVMDNDCVLLTLAPQPRIRLLVELQ